MQPPAPNADGPAVDVDLAQTLKDLAGFAPRVELELAAYAVGVDDFSDFQILAHKSILRKVILFSITLYFFGFNEKI